MLKDFVQTVIRELLAREYSHLELPAVVFANIKRAARLTPTSPWYEYELEMVDRSGAQDDNFPPVPGVRSKAQLAVGAIVAVALAYGDVPVILGEVQL